MLMMNVCGVWRSMPEVVLARDSSTNMRTDSELEEFPQSGVEDMEGSGSVSQHSSELKATVDDNLKHLLKANPFHACARPADR